MNSSAEHFCTLFDLGYLPQGMALRDSLERHVSDFLLWILCMDQETEDALARLNLRNVRLISLREIESPELLAVKNSRSHGEYCWTLSPFLPKYILACEPSICRITYLDADVWVMNSLRPIFQEFEDSEKHILYTEHGYAPEYDQSLLNGRYCVQLLIYRNTPESFRVLDWWGNRCLEWCYSRREDGKLGDQRYLEKWESLFEKETHVLQCPQLTLAPWNAIRFPIGSAVIFHFHGLRIFKDGFLRLWRGYRIPIPTRFMAYFRYALTLKKAVAMMNSVGIQGRFARPPRWNVMDILRSLQQKSGFSHWDRIAKQLERYLNE